MNCLTIGLAVAVVGYAVSLITAIGWCDAGSFGYPDCWHSKTAERIYIVGGIATVVGETVSVISLFFVR